VACRETLRSRGDVIGRCNVLSMENEGGEIYIKYAGKVLGLEIVVNQRLTELQSCLGAQSVLLNLVEKASIANV
jgi:hypothetical protein